MSFAGVVSVIASVGCVTTGSVSMVRRLLVLPAFMVLSCLSVVAGGFGVMFRRFAMMFCCLLRHSVLPVVRTQEKVPTGRFRSSAIRPECAASTTSVVKHRLSFK
jgi:hypothetical protein